MTCGVGVIVGVGENMDMAVTVSTTDVSIERMGDKVELGFKRMPHALSRDMVITIKNNEKKCFLNRMAASIMNKKAQG